jgi:hypothetical protein
MAINIRRDLVEWSKPIDPNYSGVNSVTQKIYPQRNPISAGLISGNVDIQLTVPSGYKFDISKSYFVFNVKICVAAGTVIITTAPAWNMPAAFFKTGQLLLNDTLCAQSNNVPIDDTLIKRVTNSYTKNSSVNSASFCFGSTTDRFNYVQTVLTHGVAWRPDCILSTMDTIIPENVKVDMRFTVDPNLHTALNSKAFVKNAAGAADGTLVFNSMYYVASFVKVAVPTPMEVFIPAYNVKSTITAIPNATSSNFQITIPKETYKVAVALSSSAATIELGATNLFTSGTGVAGITQSIYSQLLTSMQLRLDSQSYPIAPYTLEATATTFTCADAFLEYIANTEGTFNESGHESIAEWQDPKILTDRGLGRIFLFNIVKPSNSQSTNAELTLTFSAAPTSTNAIVCAISKSALAIRYGANHVVERVEPVPYS